jgi:hypothetical protein
MWFAFSVALAASPSPVTLQGPTGEITDREGVTLTITASGTTFVDGCAPVEWERREGAGWVAVPREPCPAQKPAAKVTGTLTLTTPALAAGEYRALVTWGSACAADLPLQLGACKTLDYARSEPFRVRTAQP